MSVGHCGKQTVVLKVKSELDKLSLHEITTLLNNTCNLHVADGHSIYRYDTARELKR